MKLKTTRLLTLLLLCVLALFAGACGGTGTPVSSIHPPESGKENTVEFKSTFIRIHLSEGTFPAEPVLFTSAQQVADFYNTYKAAYGLDSVLADASFKEHIQQYDDAYFKTHVLALLLREEGSGSNRLSIEKLYSSKDNSLTILLRREQADIGTADMAYWAGFVEYSNHYAQYALTLDTQEP